MKMSKVDTCHVVRNGPQNKEITLALAVSESSFGLLCQILNFASSEHVALNTAILCLAVWVCILHKAGMSGSGVYYIMSQPFSALHL